MESNKAITPESMRVLLVALGAEECEPDMFALFEVSLRLETWVMCALAGDHAKLILACAVWLESEAVRKDEIRVIHDNMPDSDEDHRYEPETEIYRFYGRDEDRKIFTGPFGVRVVAAAAEVAGMMGVEKK